MTQTPEQSAGGTSPAVGSRARVSADSGQGGFLSLLARIEPGR
jgi:hypothetical protein